MTDLPPPPADRRGAEEREGSAELGAVLAQMGAVLLSPETITSTVELVTTLAVETMPGTAGAGVSLMDGRGKRSTAASDPLVEQADLLQYELDAGPCLTAWRDQVAVAIDDVDDETRWPQWTAAVTALGIRSMLSVPLVAAGTAIGAIKVYSNQVGAYDARARRVLDLFARQAAVLLSNTQTLAESRQVGEQLSETLRSRDVIGQAKGVLLAQGAADDQAAFQILVSASQRSNVKLYEVARQMVTAVTTRNAGRATAP